MSSARPQGTKSWQQLKIRPKHTIPDDVFIQCSGCGETVYRRTVEEALGVCPECDHHFYVDAKTRIQQLLDEDSFEEWYAGMSPADPLEFKDKKTYKDRIAAEQKKTGMRDACVVGKGYMRGRPLIFALTDKAFIMGSMGSVVGEKLTRAIEKAIELDLPIIILSGSGGGARMHEGILSLMQMGKVSAALARLHKKGGLFISVLTNPTMGGVAASFASLGDFVIAEPNALVGFAGPRVVQSTCKIELPDDFQTSEFLLEHGFVDRIVHRRDLGREIARLIDYCGK
ncbi:acetyl-CoA carboxylase, carboxyltransferase subunit beta [bacterium]|nr:acetyl-CoA carboxylase, carboxyltransferase subunit beta [bacterium]